MTDTLTALQQHAEYVARSLFNAAKTTREATTIVTKGFGNIVGQVIFDTPFLSDRPIVNTGWVLLAGYSPAIVNSEITEPTQLAQYLSGIIVSVGVRSWITHADGQGNTVYDGAYVLLFVSSLTGEVTAEVDMGSSETAGGINEYDVTIEHHIVFEGLSYNPVPQELSGGGTAVTGATS